MVRICDDKLAARRRAVRIKPLAAKIIVVAVVPGRHKAAILKRRHRYTVLRGVGQGIDPELITDGVAAGVITLAIDTFTRTVSATLIGPHHHHAPVIQRRRRRIFLRARCVRIDLELFRDTRLSGPDHDLVGDVTCHDNNRIGSPGIQRIDQASPNLGNAIAVLDPVAHLRRIDRDRVNITCLDRAGQLNHVRLVRQVVTGDNRHIIAVTEVDRLRIGHRNTVIAGPKRQRIDAITKIDGKTVLGRIKDQCLVTRTTDQLGIAGLRAVGIEVLREDAPVAGTVIVLILRFPSDNKAAIGKRRHHRILLRLIRLRTNLELIANRDTAGVIALGEDAILVTVLIATCPGDNKSVTAQAGHRCVILRSTCVRIGLEQITARDRRVIIRSRNHRELLTKHRPAAVIEPGTQFA